MDHHELAQDILSRATGLEALVTIAASVGFLALLGFLSLRALRQLPDFEHKADMVWGAKWYWTVLLAICGAVYGVLCYGLTATPYSLTTVMTTPVLLSVLLWLSTRYLEHQSTGAFFCMSLFNARVRGKQFDFDEWQESQRQSPRKQRITRAIVTVVHVVIAGFYLYIVLSFCYPLDCSLAEIHRVDTFGQHVKVQLHSERIEEFHAYAPVLDVRHLFSTGAGQQAWLSLSEILGLRTKAPGLPDRNLDYYHIFIKVKPGTRQAEAEGLLARTQQALSDAGEENYWRIIVWSRDRAVSARGVWP